MVKQTQQNMQAENMYLKLRLLGIYRTAAVVKNSNALEFVDKFLKGELTTLEEFNLKIQCSHRTLGLQPPIVRTAEVLEYKIKANLLLGRRRKHFMKVKKPNLTMTIQQT